MRALTVSIASQETNAAALLLRSKRMKALAIIPGSTSVHAIDVPEPSIASADQVKVKVLRVGICGTDREEAAGGRALAPIGQKELIIGHEMIGRVVGIGKMVTRVKPGDLIVFTVRRGCGSCLPCAMNRSDMCTTGKYSERGIWGLDGYEAEYVVDSEQYAVRIPDELESIAVLTEPMSIVEKAIDEAVQKQDSIGGLIECTATGIPAGLGEPFFDSVESVLSHILFSILFCRLFFPRVINHHRKQNNHNNEDDRVEPDG